MMRALNRRAFLPALAAAAAAVSGMAGRPAASRRGSACTPANRARLREAVATLETAIDDLIAIKPDWDQAFKSFRTGLIDGETLEGFIGGRWQATEDRFKTAEDRLLNLMRECGAGALITGGELYFDFNQDDSQDIETKAVFTLDSTLLLDLDAEGMNE